MASGTRRTRAVAALIAGLAAVVLGAALTSCSTSRAQADPTWVPASTPSPVPLPTPVPSGGDGSSSEPPSSGGSTSPGQQTQDPAVVATKLKAPTGLAVLPDGTALVGERTTGRLLQVQPVAGKPVRVLRTLTGLDVSGGGGLLDLALSASYGEDGLILALITTKTDTRVVHFTLRGPVTPIVTGIPRGPSDNTGRLLVLPDSSILIGTGDAGVAANAAKPGSLSGKVLHVDELGKPVSGSSRVFTSGHRTVNGLCASGAGTVFETETSPKNEVNALRTGTAYGWPSGSGTAAVATVPGAAGIGGCAFINDAIFVASLGGQALFRATVDAQGKVGTFTPSLSGRYGRLLSVVAAPDGSLWLTTSNRDGHGKPVAADERVLHITPEGGGGDSPA